jgi:hypothetical protein
MNAPLRPPKFYKEPQFMNSPDARSLRILSEYLGPLSSFHREKIKDTIVFFGSARAIPKNQAEAEYRELLKQNNRQISDHAGAEHAKTRLQLRLLMRLWNSHGSSRCGRFHWEGRPAAS